MNVNYLPSVAVAMVVGVTSVLHAGEADTSSQADANTQDKSKAVSYDAQIRPIFQTHCQGCHQPAKANGEFVMTSFEALVKGGASGLPMIEPGKPDESYLVSMITPTDGMALMPKDKPPLSKEEIDLIRRWIAEGAKNDTPAGRHTRYDQDHPPVYTRPPVMTSLDFSPDGKLLAVSGFHEVLLLETDGAESKLVARLIGMSERIESVSFSPDGSKLLVTGGRPARRGEVQVWDVAKRELILSVPTTYDTVYGGSWSPDGKMIAFGCSDTTVRAINAETGAEALFQGAHGDWVLDTVFSADGSHLVSVSRDMTVKLTEVASQRFVDNVTSITPGALRGGVFGVARHPTRDEIVIGGADGVVKIYRMHRLTKRVIGDDANLIRQMPPMKGRVFDVAVSGDGTRIAAGSSLDGTGQVAVYSYEFDTSLPDNIKKISEKRVGGRSAEEKAALEAYRTNGVKQIAGIEIPGSGIYAVTFRPDGKTVAAAGTDGLVRLIDADTGEITGTFSPAPLTELARNTDVGPVSNLSPSSPSTNPHDPTETKTGDDALPNGASVAALQVSPEAITLNGEFAYAQLIVTATLDTGDALDVTRIVQRERSNDCATVSPTGLVRPHANGRSKLTLSVGGQSIAVPVSVSGLDGPRPVDYVRDVAPVLSRLSCNAGTCHGAQDGQNGFKLSLRGYDPLFDVRALTDDLASRRISLASPENSLALLKISGAAPHGGGVRTQPGQRYYEIIRAWIASGAKLDLSTSRVTGIEIVPRNPVIQDVDAQQQVRVIATYDDGQRRDVTREAFITSGSTDTATTEGDGLMTALRRGEAPILARYEGAYAATTLTIMGDRTGFEWKTPPAWGHIDELVAAKWERMKIDPSPLCSDAEFLRRVSLDLTGLPPTAQQIREFMADPREARVKRSEVVGRLVGSEEFVEYWTNKWADLLQVNGEFLGRDGAVAFRKWIRAEVEANTPYDEFARKVLTADGSNHKHPAASYYKILREPNAIMENTTQLFLGVRFNCNKCHDHPFERWTQDQYYELAAYFAHVGLKRDPESGERKIGGTAVEGAKPLYEIVYFDPKGAVTHQRTGEAVAPGFPFQCDFEAPQEATPREELAAWVTSPDNAYFAMSYVNRLWGYMLGQGLIDPIDDIRAGNPPTNPQLLDYLESEFIESGFDIRHMMKLICKSRTYQLSIDTNEWNQHDETNYSHALARRLPAEVIYDAIHQATGSISQFPGMPAGTRAVELPGPGVNLSSGFLTEFGRPAREAVCECARSSDMQLGPIMALISGSTLDQAISDKNNELAKLVAKQPDDAQLINTLFLRILNRPATEEEVRVSTQMFKSLDEDHAEVLAELQQRQKYWQEVLPDKEKQRLEAIAKAKIQMDAYKKDLAPKRAKQEEQRTANIAAAQKALREYEATLASKLPAWEKQYPHADEWVVLEPTSLKASNGTKLTAESDGSVLVEQKNGPVVYTFTAETDLAKITGIRLEALSDDRLPEKGPGLAKNGNFVLTEFEVEAAPKSKPTEPKKIALQTALADFSQEGYAIATAIDDKRPAANNGWAVSGGTGSSHWATFELKEPLGFEGGSILTFKLDHRFTDKQHNLGRFRIALTTTERPVGLSVPQRISEILAVAPDKRTEEQTSNLIAFMADQDQELKKRKQSLATANKPLPPDPQLKKLEATLAETSQPVPKDPKLVQLEKTAQISQQQLDQRRLTATQDLAWALINSPAFFFNH